MKRIFTDADIYEDEWYQELSIEHKLFWDYICRRADFGVWKPNFGLARFQLKITLVVDAAISAFNEGGKKERVRVLDDGRWFIPAWIDFQYPTLSEDCPAHKPLFKFYRTNYPYLLNSHLIASKTLQDKEMEIDKDKEIIGGVGETNDFNQLRHFEEFFKDYPKKIERSKALSVYCVLVTRTETHNRVVKALQNYRAHLEHENKESVWKKPKNPDKWLEGWMDWENWVPTFDETPEFKQRMAKLGVK